MTPKVSVLLPVYNVAPYIRETVNSLLRQSFADFEVIIIDDMSTDETVDIINSINDNRIRLICNDKNMGRAYNDNIGLEYVRGQYIAKMDGDDLCVKERFELQVNYLDSHPEIDVVGGWMQNFESSNYLNRYPEKPADAKVLCLFTLPTGNPSVMMRTKLFKEQGMQYDEKLRQTEDYDFFVRYIRQLKIATIQKTLIYYRVPMSKIKKQILSERADVSDYVRIQFLKSWHIDFNSREAEIHNRISMLERPLQDIAFSEIEEWLIKIINHNKNNKIFDSISLQNMLSERWFELCYTHNCDLKTYYYSSLSKYWRPSGSLLLKFYFKSIKQIFISKH